VTASVRHTRMPVRPGVRRATLCVLALSRIAAALLIGLYGAAIAQSPPAALRAEILESYPHDPSAFTQGLLLHDGILYESTGLYGRSSVRQVELRTGAVLKQVDLPPTLFGEGLALDNDRLVQLTWREGIAPTYALATLAKTGELTYAGEGWGLCFDGAQFIQSDGSNRLVFRDPATFAIVRQVAVTDQGRPVESLNELECVGDLVYANVWLTDRIVAIAKLNGAVRSVIDAAGLLSPADRAHLSHEAILNGIAYDPGSETFLLTGKLWPKLFRVRFVPK
jgi:glutamine cyclotransferase